MPNPTDDVDRLIAAMKHPLKAGVQQLRVAILASNPEITEHVKWNAPSFRFAGEDRVTFRLHPKDLLQLIFHRGTKVRVDSAEFTFGDDTGLLDWATADRGVVTLKDLGRDRYPSADLVALISRWILA
jgi:hypothetical protein